MPIALFILIVLVLIALFRICELQAKASSLEANKNIIKRQLADTQKKLADSHLTDADRRAEDRESIAHYRNRLIAAERENIQLGKDLADAENESERYRDEVLRLKSKLADAELRVEVATKCLTEPLPSIVGVEITGDGDVATL